MRVNSRKKGGRGENKAKEVLQEWTSFDFHRVPQSGGLHWKTANTSGDLVCGDPIHRFDFSIEVKNYKEINFEHLLMDNQISKISQFWEQCKSDALEGKRLPLLMMRYDGIRPANHFFTVIDIPTFKALKIKLNRKFPYLYSRHYGFVIMHHACLFTSPYKEIKKITRKMISTKYGVSKS